MFESLDRKIEAAKKRAEQERLAARPEHDSQLSPDAFRHGNQALPDGSKVPTGSVVHQTAKPPAAPAKPAAPPEPGEALVKDASNGNGKNRIADAVRLQRHGSWWGIGHLPNREFETVDGLAPLENLENVRAVVIIRDIAEVSPELRLAVGYRSRS